MEFKIYIDTAEQAPFTFTGLRSDSDKGYTTLAVDIEHRCLGRHPDSFGDYSLAGGIGRCGVERKSMADCQSTILGFTDGHRERFEQELRNLSGIEAGLVLVECSLDELLINAPSYGKKTAQQNAKILFRSILAYQQDYKVPWMFAGSRELAEQSAFWFLHRFWEKKLKTAPRKKAAMGMKLSGKELLDLV